MAVQSRQNIYDSTPSIIFSSLLAGIVMVLGHHFYHQSLNHKPVGQTHLSQEINNNLELVFPFLVKMFLVISIAASYWQVFWHQVQIRETTMSRIGTLFEILENAFEFFKLKTLIRFPVLTVMAAIAWLVPLATIFPAGSLTIELSLKNQTDQKPMPILNFTRPEFAQIAQGASSNSIPQVYGGPRFTLNRIATGTATGGSLFNFPAPAPNSSYTLRFAAPALQCQNVSNDLRAEFTANISAIQGCDITARIQSSPNACGISALYLAWAPNGTNAVAYSGVNSTDIDAAWQANTIGQVGNGPASLFIASQSTMDNSQPWSYVNCSLYNSTYEMAVNFTNGLQTVNVSIVDHINPVQYFFNLDDLNPTLPNGTDPFNDQPAVVYSTLEQFGYQAIMDMTGRLLTGQISGILRSGAGAFNLSTQSTSVMLTSLSSTPELSPIFSIAEICSDGSQKCSGIGVDPNGNNTLNITTNTGGLPLTSAVEQLFQNITLSLYSNDIFLTDEANSPQASVTTLTPVNVYIYTWWKLIVPYLAAIAGTLVACYFGTSGYLQAGVSYRQNFSTIVRTTRAAEISPDVPTTDSFDGEPVPAYVRKATIKFPTRSERDGGIVGGAQEEDEENYQLQNVRLRSKTHDPSETHAATSYSPVTSCRDES